MYVCVHVSITNTALSMQKKSWRLPVYIVSSTCGKTNNWLPCLCMYPHSLKMPKKKVFVHTYMYIVTQKAHIINEIFTRILLCSRRILNNKRRFAQIRFSNIAQVNLMKKTVLSFLHSCLYRCYLRVRSLF